MLPPAGCLGHTAAMGRTTLAVAATTPRWKGRAITALAALNPSRRVNKAMLGLLEDAQQLSSSSSGGFGHQISPSSPAPLDQWDLFTKSPPQHTKPTNQRWFDGKQDCMV